MGPPPRGDCQDGETKHASIFKAVTAMSQLAAVADALAVGIPIKHQHDTDSSVHTPRQTVLSHIIQSSVSCNSNGLQGDSDQGMDHFFLQ